MPLLQGVQDETEWRNTAKAKNRHKKTALKGGFTTLLIIDFILVFPWYPERDLNPHSANAEGF